MSDANLSKCIHYAYPTSRAAAAFGRFSKGCYYLEINTAGVSRPVSSHGPYASLSDALAAAQGMPWRWDRFSMQFSQSGDSQ